MKDANYKVDANSKVHKMDDSSKKDEILLVHMVDGSTQEEWSIINPYNGRIHPRRVKYSVHIVDGFNQKEWKFIKFAI